MKLLYVAAEADPFFKTGGLGDVAYALPKKLAQDPTFDVRVVLPYYRQMPSHFQEQMEDLGYFYFNLSWRHVYCGIKSLKRDQITYYFIDNQSYFYRDHLYGEWDDGERFAYFQKAVIEMLPIIQWIPNIIHCNDWQTGMIPALLVDSYQDQPIYQSIRKVLTIHNLRFQGNYDPVMLPDVFGMSWGTFKEDGLRHHDQLSYLKAGISYSDRVTTVSPSYAQEIQTPAFGEGLDSTLRYNQWKLSGIINGIDQDQLDPAKDPALDYPYSVEDLSGKVKNKLKLQAELSLEEDARIPLIAMVSRLTDQKGCDLILACLDQLMTKDLQLVILGTGDPYFEDCFKEKALQYSNKFNVQIRFSSEFASQLYAASDIFLMPSAFEPCGLSQMIAMRYGSLPLVHETGGLKDTVEAYNCYTGSGYGFSFEDYRPEVFYHCLEQALLIYDYEPEIWQSLVQKAMTQDFSWDKPAQKYKELYRSLLAE